MTEEEQEEITTAWDEDYFEGIEGLGWVCDEIDYILEGPLELLDNNNNVVAQGDPS
jgi:ethanolamine utilization protein EutQ (cupin superfamily)